MTGGEITMEEMRELQIFHRVCTALLEHGPEKYNKIAYEIGCNESVLACSIWQTKDYSLNRLGYFEIPADNVVMEWLPNLDYKAAEEVVNSGLPLVHSDAANHFKKFTSALSVHRPGLIALPIEANGRIVGAINIWISPKGGDNAYSVALIRELSQQMASALVGKTGTDEGQCCEDKEKVKKLFEVVPRLLTINGMSMAARTIHKSPDNGCFYEFHPRGQDFTLSFGEISGNSMAAQALKLSTRMVIKTLVQAVRAPETLLTSLNGVLQPEFSRVGSLLSVFFAYFDLEKRRIVFANGGHFPPRLVRSTGEAIKLKTTGPFLCMEEDTILDSAEIKIQKGDIFLFFNRDVVETINDKGELYSDERIAEVVRRNLLYGAASLLDYILLDYHKFLGSRELNNNVMIVVLRVEED